MILNLKITFGTICKTDLLICPAGNCKTCYFNRWQSVTLMCHPQPNFMCSPHIDRYIKKQIFRDQSLHVQSSSNANFATRAINYIVKRFSFCFNWFIIYFWTWHNTLEKFRHRPDANWNIWWPKYLIRTLINVKSFNKRYQSLEIHYSIHDNSLKH